MRIRVFLIDLPGLVWELLTREQVCPHGMESASHGGRKSNMKNCMRIEMTIAIVVLLIVSAVYVPAKNAQTSEQGVTKVRIAMRDIYGALFVTIAGSEKKVTDQAQQAWIINGGRQVVYSSSEGVGGYENEGQSLHLYDVDTGNHKRIMSEYFMVETVKEVITS